MRPGWPHRWMGAPLGGNPAWVSIADNPADSLAPDKQRNESLVRAISLQGVTPAPELLFFYGVIAIITNFADFFSPTLLGSLIVLSRFLGIFGYVVVRRKGSIVGGGYYAISVASFISVVLLYAVYIGAQSMLGSWWTTSVSAFALMAFGVYPLIVLRRKWKFFTMREKKPTMPSRLT